MGHMSRLLRAAARADAVPPRVLSAPQQFNGRGKITRRSAVAGMIGLAAAGLRPRPARAATTIRMWTFLDPVKGKSARDIVLKKLLDKFHAENPSVTVVVEPQNWQQMSEKFFAAHQTGTAPDIPWIFTSRLQGAVKLGSLANLDDLFVGRWSQADKEDIDGPVWRFGATPTAHYQLANSVAIFGQLYRADLFKEAGIDAKTISTWDQFIEASKKLEKKDESGKTVRWGFGQPNAGLTGTPTVVASVLLEQDGRLFDEKLRAVWSTPAGVKGLQLEADMVRKYNIMPETMITMDFEEAMEYFLAGRIAMVRVAATRWLQGVGRFGPGSMGYLPTPSFTEGKHSPSEISSWHYGVWSGSKNQELAGKVVEYMASKEADVLWTTIGGQLPNRKSTILENREFFAEPNNALLLAAAEDTRKNGWLPPPGAGEGGWNEAFNTAFQDVIINNADPKAALQKAETAFNRMRRR